MKESALRTVITYTYIMRATTITHRSQISSYYSTLRTVVVTLLFGWVLLMPNAAAADYRGEVAGWVPWFALESGMESTLENIDDLDTVYLFVYELDEHGGIAPKADLESEEWDDFIDELEDARIEIIPTISWFNGDATHAILSDEDAREELIENIEDLVDDHDYDGVDIDFEQKLADTIDHFSTFLEELEDELGRDELVCTIEPRMRPEHRWRTEQIPDEIEYANDYDEIDRHCDRIQIMAYDQQRADIVINEMRRGVPYAPVADADWVAHVLDFALEDFDEDKTMLGVATYGRAWDVTVAPEWYRDYSRVASLNQPRIFELAEKYDSPIGRTEAGEGVISYFPETSIYKVLNALPVPEGTPKGFEAAAKALFFATETGMEIPVRVVTWSDADAVDDKLDIAKDNDLRGVSIFKIDGEEDPDIWDLF